MKFLFLLLIVTSFVVVISSLGFINLWITKCFRVFLLLSYIIPISIRVTLDFSKAFFTFLIQTGIYIIIIIILLLLYILYYIYYYIIIIIYYILLYYIV